MYLSRCTEYPWTHDVGTAIPEAVGGYRVRRTSDNTLIGEADTAEDAYALIAAHLPEDCGPAVDGSPDDL
ncbi:DUF6193 family natural product biosynthesis protein [Streptomyces sp. NPDC088725]|uniref:DUF6193 family natural product biosynthesis protein n=1 Tax=Streptomyces sp. NPDC088725 TaxID=3365873 RepID=UPI0037FB5433